MANSFLSGRDDFGEQNNEQKSQWSDPKKSQVPMSAETLQSLRSLFPAPPQKIGRWRHYGSLCDTCGGFVQLTSGWFDLFSDLSEREKASLPIPFAPLLPPGEKDQVAATVPFAEYLALIDSEEDRRRVRETRKILLYLPPNSAWSEKFTLLGRPLTSQAVRTETDITGWDGVEN